MKDDRKEFSCLNDRARWIWLHFVYKSKRYNVMIQHYIVIMFYKRIWMEQCSFNKKINDLFALGLRSETTECYTYK